MVFAVKDLCRKIRQCGLWAQWDEAPGLGTLMVGGPDAVSFLHAQLTSDVASLKPEGHQMSARVDRKGQLLCWFSLHRLPAKGRPFPVFLLVMPSEMVPLLQSSLQQFIFTEDVFLEDASKQYSGVVITGDQVSTAEFPGSLTLPSKLTGDAEQLLLWPKNGNSHKQWEDVSNWAIDNQLIRLDDSSTSTKAWDSLQLEVGWPRMGRDLKPESMVLLQTGLESHVLSTTKGCYLGQEVLARIRSYGSVKMALRGLVFAGSNPPETLPEAGAEIIDHQGNAIGLWGSHTQSAIWDTQVALAFLDRENRTPGSELKLKGFNGQMTFKVIMLPFHNAGSPSDQARSLYERAVHLFSFGQDLKAASFLEKAIGLDPSHSDSYEALGVILGNSERYHQAIDIFHRLEEVAPLEPMVHTNLSLYYMKIGNREEAERQRALSTMKQFGVADPEILRHQEEAGQKASQEEAQRKCAMFAEVLDLDPADSLALMGMGNALSELGQYREAEQCLGKAVAEQSGNSSLYLSRGKVLEKMGRNNEARNVWQQGVEVASRRGDLMPLREMEHRLLLLG